MEEEEEEEEEMMQASICYNTTAAADIRMSKRRRIQREQMEKNRKKFDSNVYLCIVGQITYLKRNGISSKKSVRCFLIGGDIDCVCSVRCTLDHYRCF